MKQLLFLFALVASMYAQAQAVVIKAPGGSGSAGFNETYNSMGFYRPEQFGAVANDGIDDAPAFRALLASLPTNRAKVICSMGKYNINSKVTVSKMVVFEGGGMMDNYRNTYGTMFETNSTTDTLFLVKNTGCIFQGIAFENTSNPTAGAAVMIDIVQSVTAHPEWGSNVPGSYAIRYCSFGGFWNNVHQKNGMESMIDGCWFTGWKNYGLFLQNVNLPDGGDLALSNTDFYPDRYTLSEASIRQESGGGLKATNCKFNARPGFKTKYHYDASFAGAATSVLAMWNNSFENPKLGCIRIRGNGLFSLATIGGNEYAMYEGSGIMIDVDNVPALEIGGGVFRGTGTETALKINNCPDAVVRAKALWEFSNNPVEITNSARIHVERLNKVQTLTAGTPIFNLSKGRHAKVTLTASTTVSFQNLVEGDEGQIVVTQDAAGNKGFVIAGNVVVVSQNGTTANVSTAANSTSVIDYRYTGGTLWIEVNAINSALVPVTPGTAVTFSTVNKIAETAASSGVWQATSAQTVDQAYGQTGKATVALASGQTGRLIASYGGTAGRSAYFLFSTGTSLAGWATFNPSWGMIVDGSGKLYWVANGTGAEITGITISSPTWVAVYRDGSTGAMKLQTSTDGTAWTDRYTFAGTSTAALNIFTDIYYYTAAQGRLTSPRIEGTTTAAF